MDTSVPKHIQVLFESLRPLLPNEDQQRPGGFCKVFQCINTSAQVIYKYTLGEHDEQSATRYDAFSFEKGIRLSQKPEDHSSWQSRNPSEDKYGGAIRAGNLIFSFSGLPEQADEALMLGTAVLADMLSSDEAYAIAASNNNRYYIELMFCVPELASEPWVYPRVAATPGGAVQIELCVPDPTDPRQLVVIDRLVANSIIELDELDEVLTRLVGVAPLDPEEVFAAAKIAFKIRNGEVIDRLQQAVNAARPSEPSEGEQHPEH